MANIKFGTDGWRAIVGKDFTEENVKKAGTAIAKYHLDNFGAEKPVIIGYDPRNLGDYFAKLTGELLASLGLNVTISDKIVPTPVLAYAAKYYGANAIMFTASHNPPEYLGMKFIPDYAGPATDEITKEIVSNIDKEFDYNLPKKELKTKSFEGIYIEHIETLIDFEKIKEAKMFINYDGLHGANSSLFTRLLDYLEIEYKAINLERDVNFGGKMPDPKEKYLPELKELCIKLNRVGLSNDGDGDRFGCFNEEGTFVSANEIIAILLKHLKENKHLTGSLVKTVGASSMLDIYAKKLGINVIETAVGFKWVGQAMRENDVIIGGEESGGLSIKGHIPEKDGIIANLLILEAMACSNKTLTELQKELCEAVNCSFINERIDLELDSQDEQDVIIDKFKEVDIIASQKIIKRNTIDGLKLYLADEMSWVLIRKSGTEPLLRIYIETDTSEKMTNLKENIKKISKS